jgi:hypothetical protein
MLEWTVAVRDQTATDNSRDLHGRFWEGKDGFNDDLAGENVG